MSEHAVQQLSRGRPWAKFLGILGLVGAGFLGLALILALVALTSSKAGALISFLPLLLLVVLLGLVVVWALIVLSYARHVEAYVAGDTEALMTACKNLRILYTFTAITYGLSALGSVLMLLLRMLGFGSLMQ